MTHQMLKLLYGLLFLQKKLNVQIFKYKKKYLALHNNTNLYEG